MEQQAPERNPFMLMINPEVVFAAMEASERLAQLNRHLCRPLDRLMPVAADASSPSPSPAASVEDDDDADEDVELPPED